MRKILIIDDDAPIRFLYSEELTEEGYDIVTSGDCHRIMEIIEKQSPDLIILDIKIGNVNGLDILQEIRNRNCDIPVILCTAYSAFSQDMKSVAASYFITKSWDLTQLKEKVRTALNQVGEDSLPKSQDDANKSEQPPSDQFQLPW